MNKLAEFGQSVWLDYIDRPLLETGKLSSMIEEGLRGLTSNPSIFNNAIGSSTDYDKKIRMLNEAGKTTFEIYDELTVRDIQDAADLFKGVFERTNGLDGYVSLEIDPRIARKTHEQVQEGLRLFKKVNRPNLMVKVPSTNEGMPVIEELTAKGVNVNATLIFSIAQYEQVVKAYYKGLTKRADKTSDLSKTHSVASVFVSRIDTEVDKMIDERLANEKDAAIKEQLQTLKGKAAVANSRIIFEKWSELSNSKEAKALKGRNANVQRVLWGSTGTKNPDYSDIKYVMELICAPTVNTIPEKTLNAYLDHGQVQSAFVGGPQKSMDIIQSLSALGIDIDAVCNELLVKGVAAFNEAFKALLKSIEKKVADLSSVH
jgi:transaldolase